MSIDKRTRLQRDNNHVEIYMDTHSNVIRISQQNVDKDGISSQNIYIDCGYWSTDEVSSMLEAVGEALEMMCPQEEEQEVE